MKELIAALLLFISAETNYNTDLPMPNIVHLDQKELEEKYAKPKRPKPEKFYRPIQEDQEIKANRDGSPN